MSIQCTVSTDIIRYNPIQGTFEALVTLRSESDEIRYPCSIAAPVTMQPRIAARALEQQARHRHSTKLGLKSQCMPMALDADPKPVNWLQRLRFA